MAWQLASANSSALPGPEKKKKNPCPGSLALLNVQLIPTLPGWSDELWDSVIALRSDATDLKSELTTLETYMNSVNKVVTSAIEASFNINANYICTTLCEHSHSAEEKMQKLEKEIKEVEESYLIALTAVAKYRQPNKKDEE